MTQDATALADEYEAGLRKMEAAGYEEFGKAIENHKIVIAALRASPRTPDAGLRDALTQIDTLAVCTGVVDPALHERMLSNIARIARAALRATSQTPDAVQKILDHEEDYLTDHLTAECGLMSGDIEGSFQRIKDALSTPSASAGPKAEAVCLYEHGELYVYDATSQTFDPAVKHPQQADGRGAVIEALDDSQSLLAMIHQLNTNGSVSEHDWETEGLSDLITKQISENRAALQQSPATDNAPETK